MDRPDHPSLAQVFLDSADRHPERVALEVDEQSYSYATLKGRSLAIAATLQAHRPAGKRTRHTAVLGQRSYAGFAGILGALCSGDAYVPMLPSFPAARVAGMISRAEAQAIVVDPAGLKGMDAVFASLGEQEGRLDAYTLISPDAEISDELKETWPQHSFVGPEDLEDAAKWSRPSIDGEDIAYILFTSGSTGRPKGVMVTHANIERFLDVVVERYGLGHEDRFSHMFDVTFDLSLFDLFGAWKVGGTLCCPTPRQRLLAAGYVVDAKLSVWFSVPSTALLMKKTRTLVPDAFPDLRWSLFCGEALPMEVTQAWAASASKSVVENLYGPTELTLACTQYRWTNESEAECHNGVVPIGEPYPQMRAKVVNEAFEEVAPGEAGELILCGPQRTPGYWRDEEKTAAAYIVPPGENEIFYRTGDRVMQLDEGRGPLVYLGRMDHQVKVRGYRIELGEIEAVLRREASVDAAIAVAWPPAEGGAGADGLVAFVDVEIDVKAVQKALGQHLPSYMVPREIRQVETFPLNTNGKIDRKALLASLSRDS